jgi:hypothetical protein
MKFAVIINLIILGAVAYFAHQKTTVLENRIQDLHYRNSILERDHNHLNRKFDLLENEVNEAYYGLENDIFTLKVILGAE